MGLVDYNSDSDSSAGEEAVAPAKAPAPPSKAPTGTSATGKKPFQKLVDRANPGKIVVHLPTAAGGDGSSDKNPDDDADGPPAKRARIGAAGGRTSRFSGFGSFLPAPKKTGAAAAASSSSSSSSSTSTSLPRPGIHLKTSGEAAFSRRSADDSNENDTANGNETQTTKGTLHLPPPKAPKAPSIPDGLKAAEDVQLVGNPLMFMPLSVSRKQPGKKKGKKADVGGESRPQGQPAKTKKEKEAAAAELPAQPEGAAAPAPPPPKKKISLFSIEPDEEEEDVAPVEEDRTASAGGYQPLFQDYTPTGYAPSRPEQVQEHLQGQLQQQQQQPPPVDPSASSATSLHALADDLQLSAKDRRALFGRGGPPASVKPGTIATFDLDREYRHNEALRQSGELEAQVGTHNPVKTIAPGKHSLQQLVRSVHSQRDALEETFAKNRATQREAGGRYGWR